MAACSHVRTLSDVQIKDNEIYRVVVICCDCGRTWVNVRPA